ALKNIFSSSETIAERNRSLRAAMAELLAGHEVPDLVKALAKAGAENPAQLLSEAARRSICRRLADHLFLSMLEREAAALPAEKRDCAIRLAAIIIRKQGIEHDKDAATERARDLMKKFQGSEMIMGLFNCCYSASRAECQELFNGFAESLRQNYLKQCVQGARNYVKDGVHDSFGADAKRKMIRSINGTGNPGDVEGEAQALEAIKRLIPDPRMRAFVTMMASQAGVSADISVHEKQNPKLFDPYEAEAYGFYDASPRHCCDIVVQGGKCYIHLEQDEAKSATDWEDVSLTGENNQGAIYGGGTYYADMVIDLEQEWPEGQAPAFTLSGYRGPMAEFAAPATGRPAMPAALAQDEDAQAAAGKLGGKLGAVLAQAAETLRGRPAGYDAYACGPVLASDAARSLVRLAAKFKAEIAPALQGAGKETREAALELGFRAMIEGLPAVAQNLAAYKEEIAEAMLNVNEGLGLDELALLQDAVQSL
ncbi:MAG: hypothetical protein HUK26_04900, partial [Duodenibacillus sp.]|nr:hypothetical protein [Duodenibacillus sp.]